MNESLNREGASSETLKRRGKHCAAFNCSNSYYGVDGKPTGFHFFRFPKDIQRRNRWCNLIKRQHGKDGFFVTNATFVCSDHFKTQDIDKKLSGRWDLRKGAEPSQFTWSEQKKHRKTPAKRSEGKKDLSSQELSTANMSSSSLAESDSVFVTETLSQSLPSMPTNSDDVAELQQKIELLERQLTDYQTNLEEAEKKISHLLEHYFSLEKIKDNNSAILFFTGFPCYEALISFYNYIEPKLLKMQYWKGESLLKDSQDYQMDENRMKPGPSRKLSYIDEFLLVLMRLKIGLFVEDLADRFGISTSLVTRICITWINLLYFELKVIFPFPSQELVRKNMPKEFAKYPTTRIILDCTEIFIQRPSAMLAQSQTWSDYKHHNTWKLLVGITPNGQVTFLSDLWGGRVSDKQITRESGVLNLLEPGDNVMVDRGFDIFDIVPEGVNVNMPPFLGGRNQMHASETEETMSIASVRIHVERAIGRMKTYHILDGTLPNTLSPYATQVTTVCGLLTNFLPPLLPPATPEQPLS